MSASDQPIVHTPGPWKYHEGGAIVMTEDGQMSVADIRGFGKLETSLGTSQAIKVMDANGRLIAKAPELFKEIENVIDALDPAMSRHEIVELRERLIRFQSSI
jgi:hypothetical protein